MSLRCSTLVFEYSAFKCGVEVVGLFGFVLLVFVAIGDHAAAKFGVMPAAWVYQYNGAVCVAVLFYEICE